MLWSAIESLKMISVRILLFERQKWCLDRFDTLGRTVVLLVSKNSFCLEKENSFGLVSVLLNSLFSELFHSEFDFSLPLLGIFRFDERNWNLLKFLKFYFRDLVWMLKRSELNTETWNSQILFELKFPLKQTNWMLSYMHVFMQIFYRVYWLYHWLYHFECDCENA